MTVDPVSVVVLTWQEARTIEACLRSLGDQTVLPAEIVVVDDDSTDETLAIVAATAPDLDVPVRVVRNGSHNISRGRNLGIEASAGPIVAFLDADAFAARDWVAALQGAFAAATTPGVVGGEVLPAHASRFAEALTVNDSTVRDLFARGTLLISGCNMAVHLDRIGSHRFDERFVHAEDIELVHRACDRHPWAVATDAVVHHESRADVRGYLRQMYRYGAWKVRYSRRTHDVRVVDLVPSAVIVGSVAALPLTFWSVLALPALCLAEAAFVLAYRRPPARLAGRVLLGWAVKNLGWGMGVLRGAVGPALAA